MKHLNNKQTGLLFRQILQYANTGSVDDCKDPMVNMTFLFIRQQMDKDSKKYEEICKRRAEAGKKGGRPRKQTEQSHGETEKLNGFLEKQTKANESKKSLYDNEYESEYDCECESDDDNDTMNIHCRRRQEEGEDAHACEDNSVDNSIFPYGVNQVPTTQAELDRFQTLADELMQKHHGRTASNFDVERVFDYAYRPSYNGDGEAYAAYDTDRADLLAFVFDRAAEQNRVTWKYIGGILDNYRKRGVDTVSAAIENEYAWNRGEVLA